MLDQLSPELRYLIAAILIAHVLAGLGFCMFALRRDHTVDEKMAELAKQKKD